MTTRTPAGVVLPEHTVARVASCSFDDLSRLTAPRSSALAMAAERAAAELDGIASQLCARLFEAVPRAADGAARRLLVNLQRDVFRKRAVKADLLERSKSILGAHLLEDYVRALDDLASLEREADATFARELAEIRGAFREQLRGEVMQDALVLSSTKLLDSLNRFYLVRTDLNGKDLDAEVGAMKYFSRAAAKTSPFSKFTAVTPVSIGEASEPLAVGNPSMDLHSTVRLNARLLFLVQCFLAQDPVVRAHLPLRLNSTLAPTEGGYRFLTNWNNIEAFQQIAAHPGVDFVVGRLAAPVRWPELDSSIRESFDCEADGATALIEKLLAVGLVEIDLGVSGSDPDWDLTLAARLRDTGASAAADSVTAALAEARREAEAFARAHAEERVSIRARILDTLAAAMPSADGRPQEIPDETVFEHGRLRQFSIPANYLLYEDATVDLRMRVRREDAEALVASAARLVDAFADFDASIDERERVEAFFAARYPAGSVVPLLALYEDLQRHRKNGDAAAMLDRTRARVARNERLLASLKATVASRIADPVVRVRTADLDAVGFPDGSEDRAPVSHSVVMQCYVERDVLCGVVNGFGPGFGKLANRFLHLLPSATTDEMRGIHRRLSGGALFAEAVDASYFNANVHPPLMPFEISVPSGHTSLPASQQLGVRDLVVRRGDGGLELVHAPSGRRAYAFDCGLQRVTSRSKLYQLLALFAPCGQPTAHPLLGAVNGAAAGAARGHGASVVVWPRIVFDDRLVVQRRRWDVPPALLPLRSRGESARAWFARVDRWRRDHGIPLHVFARIGFTDPKEAKAKHRDDSKPQFIAFDNPLLVSVFDKMLGKVETGLELTEMLPASDQLMEIDGKRHVTEHVFQWYRGGE